MTTARPTRWRRLWAVIVLAAGCSNPSSTGVARPSPPSAPATTVAPAAPTTTVSTTFTSAVSTVTAADLPSSWRPGCPVAPGDLRMVRLSYWGFDDRPHTGALVVHAAVTDAVVRVFRALFDGRFPIRRMEPVDVFSGDDPASMAADNTSGFNCREAVGNGPPHWSAHAYGRAVDVDPVENPYLQGGTVQPPAGQAYVDRTARQPGMIVTGDVVTTAFAAVGWSWGGRWARTPDWQHFSSTGG